MKIEILIVDDEENIRKVIRKTIEKNINIKGIEIEIQEAENADNALNMAKNKLYHIILLDLVMPGLDAFEFLEEIKTMYPLSQVIVITGNSTTNRVLKAIELGASDYIQKAIDNNVLIETLECTIKKIKNWKAIFKSSVS